MGCTPNSNVFDRSSFFTYPPIGSAGVQQHTAYILLHAYSPQWIVANQTTLEIARSLDRGEPLDQVVKQLIARFGIPTERAASDVSYVAEQLARAGLLTRMLPPRAPALDTLRFHLTSRCNLSCPHCFAAEKAGDFPGFLIFRLVDELIEHGGKNVIFTGGEPLLYPEIKETLQYAASKLRVRLLTNATLIDRNWAAFLAGMNCDVQISIDGSSREIHDSIRGKGSYDKSLRAVEYLQEAGLGNKISFSATIMNQNLRDLSQIIHLAERLGVASVHFTRLLKEGRAIGEWESIGGKITIEDLEAFYRYTDDIQRDHRCSIEVDCGLRGFLLNVSEKYPDNGIWCDVCRDMRIGLKGDVFPCPLLTHEQFRLGNVFSQSLAELIHTESRLLVCNTVAERRTKITKCGSCLWQNLCQAGCMGRALHDTGTIWNTDDFCDYRRKAYEAAFDRILEDFCATAFLGNTPHKG